MQKHKPDSAPTTTFHVTEPAHRPAEAGFPGASLFPDCPPALLLPTTFPSLSEPSSRENLLPPPPSILGGTVTLTGSDIQGRPKLLVGTHGARSPHWEIIEGRYWLIRETRC